MRVSVQHYTHRVAGSQGSVTTWPHTLYMTVCNRCYSWNEAPLSLGTMFNLQICSMQSWSFQFPDRNASFLCCWAQNRRLCTCKASPLLLSRPESPLQPFTGSLGRCSAVESQPQLLEMSLNHEVFYLFTSIIRELRYAICVCHVLMNTRYVHMVHSTSIDVCMCRGQCKMLGGFL